MLALRGHAAHRRPPPRGVGRRERGRGEISTGNEEALRGAGNIFTIINPTRELRRASGSQTPFMLPVCSDFHIPAQSGRERTDGSSAAKDTIPPFLRGGELHVFYAYAYYRCKGTEARDRRGDYTCGPHMQRLAYFKVCEVHEPQPFDLRHLLATRYPPSSTIYPRAASENGARWARGWIMVLVELKFSTLGVFKFDHGPRRCGPNMPYDRRCVCFPLRWRVVPGRSAVDKVNGSADGTCL